MRAYRTLLTHLSQRYSRQPISLLREAEANQKDGAIAASNRETSAASMVAFDCMVINLADLPRLPCLAATLANFFEREQALALQREVSMLYSLRTSRVKSLSRYLASGRQIYCKYCTPLQVDEREAQIARSERIERELESNPSAVAYGGLVAPVLSIDHHVHSQNATDEAEMIHGESFFDRVWASSVPLRLCTATD